jgi:hypothetical protein
MKFNYGKRISIELSNYIRKYTTGSDQQDVTEMDNINCSNSSLRDVVLRYNPLSSDNVRDAVIELMRIAIANSTRVSVEAKKDTSKFKKMLPKI